MSWITDEATQAWNYIKSTISGAETKAEAELSALEQEYLPAFHAFVSTEITLLEGQAMKILKDGLVNLGQTFLSGGDVSKAIADLVPTVMAEVTSDVAQDIAAAKNAIYTAIGLKLAEVSSASVNPSIPSQAA